MTSTQTVWTLAAGQHIRGTYYGMPYSGVVTSLRPHTMNHAVLMLDVKLDAPISVFGLERDSMIVHASDRGSELARFQDAADTLEVL